MPNIKREMDAGEGEGERPKKKRRVSDPRKPSNKTSKPTAQKDAKTSPAKKGANPIGSMIGRKRKERKMKKAGK